MGCTIDEFLMSAEYVMSEGNPNVILCERGIRTFETRTRNTFDANAIPVVHHLSHLPIIAGTAMPATPLALHRVRRDRIWRRRPRGGGPRRPQNALSDGAQALTPAQFSDAMKRISLIRSAVEADLDQGPWEK